MRFKWVFLWRGKWTCFVTLLCVLCGGVKKQGCAMRSLVGVEYVLLHSDAGRRNLETELFVVGLETVFFDRQAVVAPACDAAETHV